MLGGNNYLLKMQSMAATYELDCIKLREYIEQTTGVSYPFAQVKEAVKQVACESWHPNHSVPAHILRLVVNKQYVEQTPKALQIHVLLQFPFECEQGCLKKFYALLQLHATTEGTTR